MSSLNFNATKIFFSLSLYGIERAKYGDLVAPKRGNKKESDEKSDSKWKRLIDYTVMNGSRTTSEWFEDITCFTISSNNLW